MLQEDGLGDYGSDATWFRQPNEGDDRMNEKDEEIAHAASYQKSKTPQKIGLIGNSPATRIDVALRPDATR